MEMEQAKISSPSQAIKGRFEHPRLQSVNTFYIKVMATKLPSSIHSLAAASPKSFSSASDGFTYEGAPEINISLVQQ
jgi:hypothetical protein